MWDYKSGLGFGISLGHRTIDKNGVNGRDAIVFINLQGVKAGIVLVEDNCVFYSWVLLRNCIGNHS